MPLINVDLREVEEATFEQIEPDVYTVVCEEEPEWKPSANGLSSNLILYMKIVSGLKTETRFANRRFRDYINESLKEKLKNVQKSVGIDLDESGCMNTRDFSGRTFLAHVYLGQGKTKEKEVIVDDTTGKPKMFPRVRNYASL